MSPSTTPHGYPYPLGTDRVADGDESIRDLAQAVDTRLGVSAGGTVLIPITTAATNTQVAVTYPVGRFPALPAVSVTPIGTAVGSIRASVRDATTAGMTIVGYRDTGTGTFSVAWLAVLAP